MRRDAQLEQARHRAIEIAETLCGRRLQVDPRSKLSAACFAVAQQHHNAILILLSREPPLEATAFALLRPLVESAIRGLWLSHVATNEQVKDYVLVGAKLDMASMLIAVGKVASVNAYAAIYKHWPSLSGYTHTGEDQVQRWLRTEHIEPAYSKAELSELIQLSGGVAELVFQAVLAISSDR